MSCFSRLLDIDIVFFVFQLHVNNETRNLGHAVSLISLVVKYIIARFLCAGQTGFGAKKTAGKKQKAGSKGGHKGGKPAKKAKTNDMQAQVIQAAFRKYKVQTRFTTSEA